MRLSLEVPQYILNLLYFADAATKNVAACDTDTGKVC